MRILQGMDTNTTPTIKPFEIFRAGTFTAVNGQRYTFTDAQVRELAETYNPEFSDAPLVVGHPKLTSPRYGRVSKLAVNSAGVLCAEPDQLVAEFAAAVNNKHYPKVSASIFLPDAPGNPTPGKHYLRHVGFLGGVAPAVKGLAQVEFAASDDGIAEFGYEDRIVTRLLRGVRDWLIETAGLEKAQQVIPDYELESLDSIATQEQLQASPASGSTLPAFSDPHQTTEPDMKTAEQQQAELDAQKKILDEREAKLRVDEAALNRTKVADFAEALVTDGKLLPGQKQSVIEILSQLETANLVADFAAGDENHGKTGAELFKGLLIAMPKLVEYERITKPGQQAGGVTDFAAPVGATVDQEGLETVTKANEYMTKNPGVTFIEAVAYVQATGA
ncbi:MAG: hypothetical protein GAK35_03391 [Herbaspirillum frisingense]|uniref:Peptidase n=1 Tax=Herbaspirillum frisingense TaxID=92645 RepID=A0A7V8FUF7_9BURK|nr:MAG: hypothetical protein GAK35_03391 [Herbaspirillum frisingense]